MSTTPTSNVITVLVPIKTVSANVQARHWGARSSRAKKHREGVYWMLMSQRAVATLPVIVTLCRIAPSGGLDGHDNLRMSLKHAVDGVADWLGVRSDADERIEWRYQQERGKEYAVRVTIEFKAAS